MIRPALPSPVALLPLALLAFSFGCRPADEIRTYTVPKDQAAAPVAVPQPQTAAPSRMIAAMIAGDQRAWFFKAMGPTEQMDAAADAINAFLRTVKYDADAHRPTWTTPDGWTEKPSSGMRLATLLVPAREQPVEVSIIGLALPDDWDAGVLDNVNRWRGQLSLDPLAADSRDGIEPLDLKGRDAVLVDLVGEANAAAMMPPMAGGLGGSGMGRGAVGDAGRAAGPMASSPPAENPHPPQDGPVSYELPAGWRELPPTGMRAVNVRVGEGDAEAVVTGMAFPSSAPEIADPLANANRWFGENGMPSVDEAGLADVTKDVKISDHDGTYFEMLSTEHERNTLAAMVERGPMVWFFKLSGPAATVSANRDAFREWLDSVRFNVP